ncbi:fish-egg lectin-like isoform X2 [Anguilla rostrata]
MLKCWRVPGRLRQVEAGQGKVYGIGLDNVPKRLVGRCWSPLDGHMKHISVGPAGVWATDLKRNLYTLQEDTWKQVPGTLEQVDAGGSGFLTGVKECHLAFCADIVPGAATLSWTLIPGKLGYYSCGPEACWGVGEAGEVYVRTGAQRGDCVGKTATTDSRARMAKVEVGSDGSVFALSTTGVPYERVGISSSAPQGTGWVRLRGVEPIHSLSYDRYTLWLLNYHGELRRCIKVPVQK